jgi:GPH family glycoside/pentoside/hexuronide:cation symporter
MSSKKLDNQTILSYGILSLPIGVLGIPMGIYLAPFYAGELGLPLAVIGSMLMLSRVSDFITDPLIGMLSDRWRPSIGRRRVWLPIGTTIMMIGVSLLLRPSGEVDALYFLMAVSITYLGYTTLQLPYTAWGAELSPDYHVRTKVTASAKFFDTFGLVISTIIPAVILSQTGAKASDVMNGLSLFVLFALPICATITFFRVPEPPQHKSSQAKIDSRQAFKLIARNKPFAIITIALFIATVAEVFRQTITLFYANEIIGIENIGTVFIFYFATGLLMIPAWTRIANRFEKHRTLAGALSLVFITNVGMYFLDFGQTTIFTIFFLIKGACFSALLILPLAMVADTVDIDAALTGERRQGMFFAIGTMVQKLAYAIGQGIPLILLGFIGFDATGSNGPEELYWLTVCYSIVPAATVGFAILAVLKYSLTAKRQEELKSYLDEKEINPAAELPAFLRASKA